MGFVFAVMPGSIRHPGALETQTALEFQQQLFPPEGVWLKSMVWERRVGKAYVVFIRPRVPMTGLPGQMYFMRLKRKPDAEPGAVLGGIPFIVA